MLLEDLLADLEVSVDPLALCSVAPGWQLRLAPTGTTVVHYVLEGEGRITVAGHSALAVRPGTLVVVPGDRQHGLAGVGPTRHRVSRQPTAGGGDSVPQLVVGAVGPTALRAICAWVDARVLSAVDLFAPMVAPIVVESTPSVLRPLFAALLDEAERPAPARRATVAALMQACIVVTLRGQCTTAGDLPAWLGPSMPSRVRPALEHVLDDPGAAHTVDSLARDARMSRSAFSSTFLHVVGEPPMAFVRRVRLQRAATLLRMTDLPVEAVAHAVGFSSRSHFSQAFADTHGASPSQYRRPAFAEQVT